MRRLIVISISFAVFLFSQWQTDYEQSNFLETPRYPQTIQYAHKLADHFPEVHYTAFGMSPQNRELPLLIIDKDGLTDPVSIRERGRIVVLIQAGIHSGEIEGKDAGFILFRDMLLTGKNKTWLDKMSFLFIPIFNVDGHERFSPYGRINQNGPQEMGWRVTSQNLNLNRDYLKADTPEMQAWVQLYQKWLPEFFMDIHTTDGADYQYAITYAVEDAGSMAPAITQWIKEKYTLPLEQKMAERDFPTRTYIFFRKRHQVKSGLVSWTAPPRFSQGYTALFNRPGVLVETHMLKDYKTRVDATIAILNSTFEILNGESQYLRTAIAQSNDELKSMQFRSHPYPLIWQMSGDSVMVDFLGVEYTTVHSDLSGGDWVRFSDRKKTFRIPFFNGQKAVVFAKVPEAYIIPAQWSEVIDRLQKHGVRIYRLTHPQTVSVSTYTFTDVHFSKQPYEGRFSPSFKQTEIILSRLFPAGSAVIPLQQIRAKLVLQALEPQGIDSFLKWGFFNAIFERKEYVESYVIEDLMRKMLTKDDDLKKQFAEKMKTDTLFAQSSEEIRNWFYQRTPYWDQEYNKYPVGKLFSGEELESLLKDCEKKYEE